MKPANRRRIWVYGTLIVSLSAAYLYQPQRVALMVAPPPKRVPVDPDPAALFSKGARVSIVTAHPDDSEFYLGALLPRLRDSGAKLQLVVITDGDKGFYPFFDSAKLAKIRRAEQTEAATAWGATDIRFLGRADGRLRDSEDGEAAVLSAVRDHQPTWILSFDPDFGPAAYHRDHQQAGVIVERIAGQSGAKWLIQFASRAFNYVADVSKNQSEQAKLLAMHRSQFFGDRLERIISWRESVNLEDGEVGGFEYGTALRVRQLPLR